MLAFMSYGYSHNCDFDAMAFRGDQTQFTFKRNSSEIFGFEFINSWKQVFKRVIVIVS